MHKPLSAREAEVLRLVAVGKLNRDIAEQLKISVRTVEAHRARAMMKLSLRSVRDLVLYAIRENLIEA